MKQKIGNLKRNPWDIYNRGEDDHPFRLQQKRSFQFGHLRGVNSDDRCLGTSSRGLWHPHRAFWTFCQLRHRENQVGREAEEGITVPDSPLKITGIIIELAIWGNSKKCKCMISLREFPSKCIVWVGNNYNDPELTCPLKVVVGRLLSF